MKCENCGNIIRENSLNCPYCGRQIKEDYFGYRSADERIRQQQSAPKKDDSGKIVLIIFGVLAGVFAIMLMILFLPTSDRNASNVEQYQGSFTITPEFLFCITDEENTGEYSVIIKENDTQSEKFELHAGEEKMLNLSENVYTVIVMRTFSERIVLQIKTQADCEYNTAELLFDDMQIKTTNGLAINFSGNSTETD